MGAFAVAAALAAYLTPTVARAALALGIVDRPDGRLKRQAAPVPYLGGVAVYLAFLLALSTVLELDRAPLALLLGGTLAATLGLFDDLHALPPGIKLTGQMLGCYVLLRAGAAVQLTFLSPVAACALSAAWLLTVTNAVNLLDVADGLAAGCCAVAALALAVVAWPEQHGQLSVMAAALAGSLAGFLPHNTAPARVYLGDAGALFVGTTLAALTMQASYTERHPWAALAPSMLLSVPLLELGVLICVRTGLGLAPWRGSPHHLAHLLRERGISSRPLALTCWAASAVAGGAAYLVARAEAHTSLWALGVWGVAVAAAAATLIVLGLRRGRRLSGLR